MLPEVDDLMQDFCIPYKPDLVSYKVKGPAVWHDNDTWIEQDIQEHKASSPYIDLKTMQLLYLAEIIVCQMFSLTSASLPCLKA